MNTGTAGSFQCFPPCVHHYLEKHVLELCQCTILQEYKSFYHAFRDIKVFSTARDKQAGERAEQEAKVGGNIQNSLVRRITRKLSFSEVPKLCTLSGDLCQLPR